MNKAVKYSPLEMIRTFWPVLLFVLGFLVWALNQQTVSSAEFVELEIRTALVEEKMPDKKMMLKIHESLASMETKIGQLSQSVMRIEDFIFNKRD